MLCSASCRKNNWSCERIQWRDDYLGLKSNVLLLQNPKNSENVWESEVQNVWRSGQIRFEAFETETSRSY
jgi:hypothetical protein